MTSKKLCAILWSDKTKGGAKLLSDQFQSLANRIVRYRAKHDLNQDQFARECGLTKQTIGAIESGRHGITKLTEAKIVQVLEKEMEE